MEPLTRLAPRRARSLGALALLSCLAPGCSGDDPSAQAPTSAAAGSAGQTGAGAAGQAGSAQGAGQAGSGQGGSGAGQAGSGQAGSAGAQGGDAGSEQGGAGAGGEGGEGGAGQAGQGGEGGTAQGGEAGAGAGGGGQAKSLGFAVIDVQETFVKGSATEDMEGVLARTKSDFEQAGQLSTPFFITYEASKKGDHALHKSLAPVVPPQAKEFIKTTFAATGLPSFAKAIQQPGLSHLVVLGSETDVCVLQTALGLRKMGFSVLLQQDAVFSSEPRPSPALRRMQQAGVVLVDQKAVSGYLADPSTLPDVAPAEVKILDPLHVGVVLQGFTDEAVKASTDPWLGQKSARLRELLLVSEWFELPVYVDDPGAGLPSAFSAFFEGELRPLSQLALDTDVTQVVVAGTDGGLTSALASLGKSHGLFLAEDAVLTQGTHAALLDSLGPSFEGGLVPLTYKTFYYEMTRSVSTAQWPSKKWVERFDKYYWLTKAPEDLPPLPAD